jgi:hypothetical protein
MTHPLAETAATYGPSMAGARHVKVSVSLPADLLDELRAAGRESGLGVSGVVAAAVRQALAAAEQARIDRAIELDAQDNEAWARDALELTARAWANLEW